ncbi:Uu.00g090600.m01.CDS01 [Anthostomella pinea]|uniref:Protein BIG1 n=1 Tax=Anthostomella pinea TaxID=933095 RepID=A0AAI8YHW3_9PEZI|nr:Uu.00g090600.m01.CDS01 [Anthostomella pinea]
MRLFVTATVAALCASAQAFSDSSPFILFSTAKLSKPASQDQQLQSSSQVLESTKQLLSSCPTDRYLLVSQPNLNAATHLSSKASVPRLTGALDRAESSYSIAEVAGELDLKQIAAYIRETCDVKSSAIDEIYLSTLPTSDGVSILRENDEHLGMVLEQYQATEGSYTVIYAGGPRTEKPESYVAEFQNGVQLKRHLQGVVRRDEQPAPGRDLRPLFEKYQYFTPGIFMGLITLIILMTILYAGISAVASLEIPYGAFDKEMGPAAQKKQQ